jgi:hypothetical protein
MGCARTRLPFFEGFSDQRFLDAKRKYEKPYDSVWFNVWPHEQEQVAERGFAGTAVE